jgi:hypothetical protein
MLTQTAQAAIFEFCASYAYLEGKKPANGHGWQLRARRAPGCAR